MTHGQYRLDYLDTIQVNKSHLIHNIQNIPDQ